MPYTYLFLILTLMLLSCDNVQNKGHRIIDRTEQKLHDKSVQLADKVIPQFDCYTPDTKFNRQRFTEFLKVELTADVKNIYCCDDRMGIDASYQFAFNCDSATAHRIIREHRLISDSTTPISGMKQHFEWWNREKLSHLQSYSREVSPGYFQYFWYDTTEQKAYYYDFDT